MRQWSALILLALLGAAGCGGPQASTPQLATPPLGRDGARPAQERSWMLPEAKNETLLYVPNVYTLTVYSYPAGKLVGTIDNFYNPYGICSDGQGNVYVTDSRFGEIFVYAHGGTKAIRTLKDPDYVPYGCAVDQTTGDLAVADYEDGSDRVGNLSIYHKGRGYPRNYSIYGFYYYYWCAYDASGDLFVDGAYDYGEGFELAEMPKGKHTFTQLDYTKQPTGPGGIQWDGKYLAIMDPSTDEIYQFSVSDGLATLENTTTLSGISGYLSSFYVDGSTVLVPTQFNSGSNVDYFAYPGGGSPTKTITNGVFYPFSVTLSKPAAR